MTLAQPGWLAWFGGVVVLALLVTLGAWWQRRALRALLSDNMLQRVVPTSVRLRRLVRDLSALIGLALMVLALAEPRFDKQIQTVSASGTDLVVVLDLSRSMDARDVDPSRLERARREIADLGRLAEGDRVGLVVFAGAAYARLPLTEDFRALNLVVSEATTETFESQGSDLASALTEASKLLERSQDQAGQAVIVLSDGETHAPEKAIEIANELATANIPVYGMGIGIESAPIPLPHGQMLSYQGSMAYTVPNFGTLEQVAEITGGAFVRSNASDRDMRDLYDEIRTNVQSVERSVQKRETWRTAFQWPLSAATVLLLLAAWIGDGRRPWGMAAGMILVMSLLAPRPSWAAEPLAEADALYRAGRFAEAVEALTELSLQQPDNMDVFQRLGAARYRAGDWDGAARAYDQAARLGSDPDALVNAGNAHYRAGRLEQALDKYDDALALQDNHMGARHNRDVVQQEIELRRTMPPPQPKSSQGESSEEPQDGGGDPQQPPDPSDQQDGENGDQDSSSNQESSPSSSQSDAPQEGQPTPSSDAAPEEQGTSEAVDQEELEADGQPTGENREASPGGSAVGQDAGPITEGQAHRLLDAIEEGTQRVMVSGRSEDKPW